MTAFRENPFVYLGVSPSSSRSEILEKAEEKALTEDPDEVAKYRSILTNPGKRLESELRYLPGVSDEEANEILALLGKDPASRARMLLRRPFPHFLKRMNRAFPLSFAI